MSIKRLTIGEIEESASNEPVWALNSTADVRAPGDLVIPIPKMNGAKVDTLKIPSTWLAVCLTEQIPKVQLLASSEFRQAVNNRFITLISAEDAKHLNSQFGADEERERLALQSRAVMDAARANGVHDDNPDVVNESESLDPAFVVFMDSLAGKDDAQIYNQIRTRAKFTKPELKYMIRNLHDKPNTVTFVRDLLDKR